VCFESNDRKLLPLEPALDQFEVSSHQMRFSFAREI
jgi:hypothetical protein